MKEISKNQICCIIIAYNPDQVIYELINIIKNQVNKIILVDNRSDMIIRNKLISISYQLDIYLIKNNENFGIAKALNQGLEAAKSMGFEWALIFDQDSKPLNNIVATISEVYRIYPNKDKIGAIGVNYFNNDVKSYFTGFSDKKYKEKDYLITSGCLLSIDAFNQIGGFREDFFIDNVDLEYSLRLRKNGKVLLITKEHGMIHKAGNPIRKKILWVFNIVSTNHNYNRRYYMAKNHVILCMQYFSKFPYFILKTNYFFILSIIQLLLLEKKKKIKIIYTYKGLRDGVKNYFASGRISIKPSRDSSPNLPPLRQRK